MSLCDRGFWHQVKINSVIIGVISFISFPLRMRNSCFRFQTIKRSEPPFTFSANHILPNRNRYSVGSETTHCVMHTLASTESELETCLGPIHRPAGTRGVKEIEEIFPISDSFSATLASISRHSER